MELVLYGIYLFLAVFAAGNMVTLQFQHYGIYHTVPVDGFKEYMRANNKAAALPSILPALFLLAVNIALMFYRPAFMTFSMCALSLCLNVIAFISTFTWQRKLQSQMVDTGFDEKKIKLLNSTNWIRTLAFLIQALISVAIICKAV